MEFKHHANTYSVLTHTLDPWGGVKGQNFFSESSHVAYQIRKEWSLSTMQTHILFLHTPLTPGVGSKVKTFFSESSHVEYQIKGNGA